MALASGGINYVAPPYAVQMARDLAVLPAFIAEPGSLIITDSDLDAEWLEQLNSTFGLNVHAVKRSELRRLSDYRIMPWGWSLDMRRRLLKWGASHESVPSKDEIYHLRGLSHRRVTTLIHLRLQELLGRQLCPTPVELATTSEVMAFVEHHSRAGAMVPRRPQAPRVGDVRSGSRQDDGLCRGVPQHQRQSDSTWLLGV